MAAVQIIAFTVFAFITVAGALGMTTTMSMFRSGIFLMASFMGAAGLFILLSADLLGLLQVMMYIGGMLVMILFMVLFMQDPGGAMMAGMDMAPLERWFSAGLVPRRERHGEHGQPDSHVAQMDHAKPGETGGDHAQGDMEMDMDMSMVTPARSLAAWLAVAVGFTLVAMLLIRPAWHVVNGMPDPDSSRQIGRLLMAKYMVAFEGAGVLILVGIFGAVLLARPSSYPDDPSRSARVAIDEAPEPIADDGIAPPRRGGGK